MTTRRKRCTVMLLLYLCILFDSASLAAQVRQKLDSLERALRLPADDTTRINQLSALCYYNYSSNPTKGLEYGIQCRDLSIRANWKKGLSGAYGNIACCHYTKSEYTEAVTNWLRALRIAEEIHEPVSGIIGNIGNVYCDLGDVQGALECYLRAESSSDWLTKHIADFAQLIWMDENIATALVSVGRSAEAKIRFQRILSLAQSSNAPQYTPVSCAGYAECLVDEGQYDSALHYTELALERLSASDDPLVKATTYVSIGRSYLRIAQALLKTKEQTGANARVDRLLHSAQRYNDSSVVLFHALQSRGQLLPALQLKADLFEVMGNTDSAIHALRQFQLLKDSLHSMRQSQKLAELNFGFEQEKRDVITQQSLERQTLLRNGFIGGFVIVLLFLGVVSSQRRSIKREKHKTEQLLHNVLPPSIAKRMLGGGQLIADNHPQVSILFADIVGFTKLSQRVSANELVQSLDRIFSAFDALAEKHALEKIKTIGDAYMVIAGAPEERHDHAFILCNFALELLDHVREESSGAFGSVQLRIGIHCGEAVAGVIGKKKFAYDMWGDAVNTAARMESHGEVDRIHVSEEFYRVLMTDNRAVATLQCTERGLIEIKGKGPMRTYFVERMHSPFKLVS